MKKHILSIGMLGLLSSFTTQADTLLGIYAGAQAWYMEPTGNFYTGGADNKPDSDFNFDDKLRTSFYVALEHPIPLLPNVKLQRTDLATHGYANNDQSRNIELSTIDAIMYYEILDNDLISLDLGINAKHIDGKFTEGSTAQNASGWVPMAYSRISVGVPATGLGAYVEGSFASLNDQKFNDYQAAITYNLMENLAIDLTFQIGYRSVQADLDNLDGVSSNLEFKGAFTGIEVHF